MEETEIDEWPLTVQVSDYDYAYIKCAGWVKRVPWYEPHHREYTAQCYQDIYGGSIREIRANLILHIQQQEHVPPPPPYNWTGREWVADVPD